jgi:hypothetical protein
MQEHTTNCQRHRIPQTILPTLRYRSGSSYKIGDITRIWRRKPTENRNAKPANTAG